MVDVLRTLGMVINLLIVNKMNIKAVCEDYEHHDSGLLLAAVSEGFIHEEPAIIANTLLHPKYESILKENGWDLLIVFTLHLKSASSPVYLLIQNIINISSPKEMFLALMEQFELLDSMNIFTILLPLLGNVIQSVPNPVSLLYELQVFVMRYSLVFKKIALSDIAITYQLEQPHEEEMEETATTDPVTLEHFVDSLLTFLLPFVKDIDRSYVNTAGQVVQNLSSIQQVEVIAILMELLDTILTTSADDPNILKIMNYIIMCHYGGLALLEWKNEERRDEEAAIILSRSGLSGFAYLLLAEEQCQGYLPQVIHPLYLLKICLHHVHYNLNHFNMSHDRLSMNGLVLLDRLLEDIPRHSLLPSLLDELVFPEVAVTLCHLMYKCPFEDVRKDSHKFLLKFIASFTPNARYLLYKRLFVEIGHSGVQGLLIHQVKEEVNTSIKCNVTSFLGESLYELYQQFLTASPQMDVLSEFDRVSGGLNFMRFLLLTDTMSCNKTHIWSCIQQLKADFLIPLRSAVTHLQAYCRSRLQSPHDYTVNGEVEVDVAVIGKGQFPELTAEQETETLQNSLYRLDIILSVLARVEELTLH